MAGQDAYEALRGQKTARTAGLHPDELVEPGVPVRAVTVGYVAARVPTLAGHRLACDDDGVDGRTVRFLLKQSLAEQKKEWEEERRRMVQESVEQVRARVDAENAARHASSSSTGKRRKRKKRRKKRLPRGRARRRQRQRPLSGALIVDSGSGMCRPGFPSSRCGPFGCRQAPDAQHHGRYGAEGLVCWFFSMLLVLCSLLCLQAQDARLHGRLGPQDSWSLTGAVLGQRCCAMCGVLVQTVQYWRFRSCSSSWSSSLPVVLQRQIPMVLAVPMTIYIPQLQLIDNVADVFVVHVTCLTSC